MRAEGLEPDTAHLPDAWINHVKTKVSYEIPFNRHFYVFTPPRPLDVITNPRLTPFLSTALGLRNSQTLLGPHKNPKTLPVEFQTHRVPVNYRQIAQHAWFIYGLG
jgi:hypothetical protein